LTPEAGCEAACFENREHLVTTPFGGSVRDPLQIHTESFDGTVALTIAGRADAEAADQLRAVLESLGAAPGRCLRLRLDKLQSCETPVAFDLLEFVREIKDGGSEVVVESHPDAVVSTILMLADVRDDLGLRVRPDGTS
jgi:hypothetical protein